MLKQFKVSCEDCSFENEVKVRERAEALAHEHRVETGHDIVAVEFPPKGGTG